MKHFEILYEESEKLFANISSGNSLEDICFKIYNELEVIKNTSDKLKQGECFGMVLYYISGISQKQDINSYVALNEALEELKSSAYDLGSD